MANKIFIQFNGSAKCFSAPLQDDPTIQVVSQFESFGGLVPAVQEISNLASSGQNMMSGKISSGMLEISSTLDMPRWMRTEPIKISCTLNFFLKTNAYDDVVQPTHYLLNTQCLTKSDEGYITPGVSLKSLNAVLKTTTSWDAKGKEISTTSVSQGDQNWITDAETNPSGLAKIFSLWIPGIVYLPVAFTLSANPTFSKQKTESGYPIWSKVECEFSGIKPATLDSFSDSRPATLGDGKTVLVVGSEGGVF